MSLYVYRGTEPWTPKPTPAPTDAASHALDPCGTRGAYRRHLNADEEPCTPCIEANRAYYRQWRAGKTGTRISKSGIRGVWWSERDQLWRAQVWHEGRNHAAGHHPTKEAAERAVIEKRNELRGRKEAA